MPEQYTLSKNYAECSANCFSGGEWNGKSDEDTRAAFGWVGEFDFAAQIVAGETENQAHSGVGVADRVEVWRKPLPRIAHLESGLLPFLSETQENITGAVFGGVGDQFGGTGLNGEKQRKERGGFSSP